MLGLRRQGWLGMEIELNRTVGYKLTTARPTRKFNVIGLPRRNRNR